MYSLDPFNKAPMQQQQPSSNALPPYGQQHRPCQHQQPMQMKLNQQQLNQINQHQLQNQNQNQHQNPSNPQQQFTPILIAVEPRNDESVRCDCRNCQFFSGWCCMPCALLIIIMIIVCYACMKSAAPDVDDRPADHSTASSTTGAAHVTRTLLFGRPSGGYETIY